MIVKDMMISCPFCKDKSPSPSSPRVSTRQPVSGTVYTQPDYPQKDYKSNCSVCYGTGLIDEDGINDAMRKLREVKPKREDYVIKNPKREIDL